MPLLIKPDAFHFSLLMGINVADFMSASLWLIPVGLEGNSLAYLRYFWIFKLIIAPLIWLACLKYLVVQTNAKKLMFILSYAILLMGAVGNLQYFHGSLLLTLSAVGVIMFFLGRLIGRDYYGVKHPA